MRPLLCSLILLVCCLQLTAQTKISGKISDQKGRPVRGASISIKDSYDGATADSLGNYQFLTSEKGEQTIVVSSIGFKTFEQKQAFNGSPLTLNFSIREEPNEMT